MGLTVPRTLRTVIVSQGAERDPAQQCRTFSLQTKQARKIKKNNNKKRAQRPCRICFTASVIGTLTAPVFCAREATMYIIFCKGAPKRAHALKTIRRSKDRDNDKRELIKTNRRPFNDSAANPKTSHQLCLPPSSRVTFLEPLRMSADFYTRDPSDVVLFLRATIIYSFE